MRTLKIEELEVVAGGKETPAFQNSQSKQNNGLGNGDQTAPGNSLNTNGAENNGDGTHPSGFPVVQN